VADAAFGFAASPEREAIRVRSNYRIYLGRDAAPTEVDLWVGLFKQGVTNEQMVGGFVGSPEYYDNVVKGRGNPARWVAVAYRDVLFREANREEFDIWLRFLT